MLPRKNCCKNIQSGNFKKTIKNLDKSAINIQDIIMERNKIIDLALGILIFFVLLFVYTRFAGPIPFSINSVNTNKTDLFQVSGTGKAASAPDKAKINLGITESAATIEAAQERVNTKAEAIINALKTAGADEKDIKTTNYFINPNYAPEGMRVTGYNVSQNLDVEVDVKNINKVIDSATTNGANLAGGITFTLNDSKKTELENEARKEAVANAKKKAESLAGAAGIKLGRIVDVRESFGQDTPIFLDSKIDVAEPRNEAATTNITPGENNIEVSVTLSYQTN